MSLCPCGEVVIRIFYSSEDTLVWHKSSSNFIVALMSQLLAIGSHRFHSFLPYSICLALLSLFSPFSYFTEMQRCVSSCTVTTIMTSACVSCNMTNIYIYIYIYIQNICFPGGCRCMGAMETLVCNHNTPLLHSVVLSWPLGCLENTLSLDTLN